MNPLTHSRLLLSRYVAALLLAAGLAGAGCAHTHSSPCCPSTPSPARTADLAAEVRSVLERQVQEWNAGSIERFMETYARGDATRFASGGDVTRGWDTVMARYRGRYPDAAAMGHLDFSDLDVQVLGPDAAIAFGRWRLTRAGDTPHGLFTLLFRKTSDGWRIVHDHTSSASP